MPALVWTAPPQGPFETMAPAGRGRAIGRLLAMAGCKRGSITAGGRADSVHHRQVAEGKLAVSVDMEQLPCHFVNGNERVVWPAYER